MGLADYLRASNGSGEAVMAVVVSNRLIGSSTLIVDSVLNWPTRGIATSGDLDINTGLIDPDTATVFKYHLDGSIVMIDGFAPGYSDVGNKANQVVVIKPATHWADQVATGINTLEDNLAALDAGINTLENNLTALDAAVVKKADTSLVGSGFFLDEDNMASNSDTKVPSQQSVKAYVDHRYYFSVRRTSAQSPGTNGVILYNTKDADPNNNFDTSNGRYTVPVTGFYQINVVCSLLMTGAPQDPQVNLRKNGSTVLGYGHMVNMFNGNTAQSVYIAVGVPLAAGDYLDVTIGSAYALHINNGTQVFSGFLVSRG
jgi:X-X-X-Leu-X-X-Gly heptad repeat protein